MFSDEEESRARIYSYLAWVSLLVFMVLSPKLGATAEALKEKKEAKPAIRSFMAENYGSFLLAGEPLLVASYKGSMVSGIPQSIFIREALGRQPFTYRSDLVSSGFVGLFSSKSYVSNALSSSLLASRDRGLSIGIGSDNLSVGWKVNF
jgi:hypothetical protein